MTITALIIARNEENKIEKTLQSLSFVNEIVNSVRKDLDRAGNKKSNREMIRELINPNLARSV